MKNILYTVAYDKNENLIKASDAEKGNDFYCPACKGKLILRKSGKTGKGSKRPHFAHINLSPNCNPETALHFSFKNLLFKYLEEHIQSITPLQFSWKCNYCCESHSGNLLKKIKSVKLEYSLNTCKPDIALLDKDNKVFAVIEVVVTHNPEENVLQYFKEINIILIQINLTSDKDIDELYNKISHPDFIQFCPNPICKKCGNHKNTVKMIIIDCKCWRCKSSMKIAIIQDYSRNFNKHEIEFAESRGVIIKEHSQNTFPEKFYASTCGVCNTYIGFSYYPVYLQSAFEGKIPSETHFVGYFCERCFE